MDQSVVSNPRVADGTRGNVPQGDAGFRVESDLYAPVKGFLEARGYEVKGEINGCDVVGVRGAEPPVIVELKLAFGLGLVLQGVDRLSLTDHVYLAVPRPGRRARGVSIYRSDVRGLCRRLGLGLMTVVPGQAARGVEVLLDPLPYRPRRGGKRLTRLLGEHARRAGDPNRGGATRTPLVTAYRQEALRCALLIGESAAGSLQALRETGLVPNAPRILQRDVYGWFERVARATYRLTARARQDIARFAVAGRLPALPDRPPALTAPAAADSVLCLRSGPSARSRGS
ncbi:MAG TPA: DUF2161 family putative PD-(D/E)XK-type phosphodiesterase [Candidatus Binatia bacterium]|nr:DUF2161 family putative PD-(D/E)XK-type phosphodiesterase [Candidatus Binatia bacterium]